MFITFENEKIIICRQLQRVLAGIDNYEKILHDCADAINSICQS